MEEAKKWLEEANVIPIGLNINITTLGPPEIATSRALGYLVAIQDELKQLPIPKDDQEASLIRVAIDDMKVVSGLMKIVVAYGIYPRLPDASLVPLKTSVPAWPLPEKQPNLSIAPIYTSLQTILSNDDDLSRLLLVSPFLIDIIAACAANRDAFLTVISKIPTAILYKALIPLRAVPKPSKLVVLQLNHMPLMRQDAIRSLLELVIQTDQGNEIDTAHVEKATNVISEGWSKTSKEDFANALASQLAVLLGPQNRSQDLMEATMILIDQTALSSPQVLTGFRKLICGPLTSTIGHAGRSLSIILAITELRKSHISPFLESLLPDILLPIWILVSDMEHSKETRDERLLGLLASLITTDPGTAILALVNNLGTETVPGSQLQWNIVPQQEPTLVSAAASSIREPSNLLQLVDNRLGVLAEVISELNDTSATTILTTLLRQYAITNDAMQPLQKLYFAKAIDRLAQDPVLRPKLFGEPEQIIGLGISLIEGMVSGFMRKGREATPAADTDEMDDLEEAQQLVELSLSLLNAALMELHNVKNPLNAEQLTILREISTGNSLDAPYTLRSKAELSLQLAEGTHEPPLEESAMNSDHDVFQTAMSALREPLVPSRAYGIYLLGKLVDRKAVSVDDVMPALVNSLGDDDSYEYLSSIKTIEVTAKSLGSGTVLAYLTPEIHSTSRNLDKALRAREALTKVLSSFSFTNVSDDITTIFLNDLRPSSRDAVDIRFKLSSASILGMIISQSPHSLSPKHFYELTRYAIEILRPKNGEAPVLARAVVLMSLEIVTLMNVDKQLVSSFPQLGSALDVLRAEIHHFTEHTDEEDLKISCRAALDAKSFQAE